MTFSREPECELGGVRMSLGEMAPHNYGGATHVGLHGADRLAKSVGDFTVSAPLEELQSSGRAQMLGNASQRCFDHLYARAVIQRGFRSVAFEDRKSTRLN